MGALRKAADLLTQKLLTVYKDGQTKIEIAP